MKYTVVLILSFSLIFSSLSAGWNQRPSRRGRNAIPAECQPCSGESETRPCCEAYTKFVRKTLKCPECTYTPQEKWVRGTKYVPRYYKQKFIKYVPQVYTRTIMKYEPVDTFSKYCEYEKTVSYHREHFWVPRTAYKKLRGEQPDCGPCGACPQCCSVE